MAAGSTLDEDLATDKFVTGDSQSDLSHFLKSLGYKFDLDDIKGISYKPNQKGGQLMIMYTCAVEGCNTKQARTFSKSSY